MDFNTSPELPLYLDEHDELANYRNNYYIPQHNGNNAVYLCGNSLGLQPKSTASVIDRQLKQWSQLAVEGWFEGEQPWLSYHEKLAGMIAPIAGAQTSEVTVMNSLTVNLHLLLTSFYQPTNYRFKIIMEAGAFPSDQYALESHIRSRGLDPDKVIIEVKPRPGEHLLHTEDILNTIANHGNELALVLFGGINYYTGQFYNIEEITKAAHAVGAYAAFDLAHAAGNVVLQLHNWQVDFACWCSYKYMNSGPGGISGIFVHEKHHQTPFNRLAGWWGYSLSERFLMQPGFKPAHGANGWQVSTSPILLLAAHEAALNEFNDCGGITSLRKKGVALTGYMEFLIKSINQQAGEEVFKIITPENPAERGSQLSVICKFKAKDIFNYLTANGVIPDWREPDVIRMSPVPMYNSFTDVYKAYQHLNKAYQTVVAQ